MLVEKLNQQHKRPRNVPKGFGERSNISYKKFVSNKRPAWITGPGLQWIWNTFVFVSEKHMNSFTAISASTAVDSEPLLAYVLVFKSIYNTDSICNSYWERSLSRPTCRTLVPTCYSLRRSPLAASSAQSERSLHAMKLWKALPRDTHTTTGHL